MNEPIDKQAGVGEPVVLLADDDAATREFVSGLLRGQGLQVVAVEDGHEAVNLVKTKGVDLALLDIMMPGLDGLDCCRLIKGMTQDNYLPIILLTAKSDSDSRVAGLRIGADDYICKPFDERELLARVNRLLRIKRMHDEVNASKERLLNLAVQDELTGLYNYRYLQSRVSEEFKRAERYHEPLACILVDIDFFKEVNDLFGHDAGNEVLREVGSRLSTAVREVDVVARYGGEEFLLVLPSTNFSGALSVADRVWRSIGSRPFDVGETSKRVTASLGVAVFPSRGIRSKDDLLKAADRALYQSKGEGRDGICAFQHQGYVYRPDRAPGLDGDTRLRSGH